MWYGEYQHNLDEKNRFILPSKFRKQLKKTKSKKFYLTRGLDVCLFMFLENDWRRLEEKFKSLPFTKQQARSFNRLYFSGASEVIPGSQGRVIIPDYLKDFAGINREVVIIGVSDRIEIWNKHIWQDFYEKNRKNFEKMAEDIFE